MGQGWALWHARWGSRSPRPARCFAISLALTQGFHDICEVWWYGVAGTDLLGRRRYLPNINIKPRAAGVGPNQQEATKLRLQAERQAVNSVCQGSAADLIKLAMVNIDHQLAELSLSSTGHRSCPGGGLYQQMPASECTARLVLQVHDELIYEVQESHLSTVASIVQRCMENAISLGNVPLKVKMHSGSSWDKLSPYSPNGALASGHV